MRMNWRFAIAISSIISLIICGISFYMGLNSGSERPYGTCWLPSFPKNNSNTGAKKFFEESFGCPFKLQFVGLFNLALFLTGYFVVGVLDCFVPPHIMYRFQRQKWVSVVVYLFIIIAFSLAVACMLSAIGLFVYYTSYSDSENLILFYTGNILKSCREPHGSCASFILLCLSTFITLVAAVLGITEIILAVFSIGSQGYSSL